MGCSHPENSGYCQQSTTVSQKNVCHICNRKFKSADLYISHLKCLHWYIESYACPIDTCFQGFNTIYALNKHIKLKHIQEKHEEDTVEILSQSVPATIIATADIQTSNNISTNVSSEQIVPKPGIRPYDYVTTYMTQFYKNPTVTRKFIQDVMNYTHSLLSDVLSHLKLDISINVQNLTKKQVEQINNRLNINPLENVLTEHKRFKFLENSRNFIKPIKVKVGQICEDKRVNGTVSLDVWPCYIQIVEIEKVLKQLLQIPNVLETIKGYIASESKNQGVYTSVFSGKLWLTIKNNILTKLLYLFFCTMMTMNAVIL